MLTLRVVEDAAQILGQAVSALLKLPTTPNGVAAVLAEQGCKGTSQRGHCPLVIYVRKHIGEGYHIEIDALGLFVEADSVSFIWDLPAHLANFVVGFDRDLFPELRS